MYRKPCHTHPVLILLIPPKSSVYSKPCYSHPVLILIKPQYSSVHRRPCHSQSVLFLPVPQYSCVYRRPCHSQAVLFLPGPGHQHGPVRWGGRGSRGRRLNVLVNLYRNKAYIKFSIFFRPENGMWQTEQPVQYQACVWLKQYIKHEWLYISGWWYHILVRWCNLELFNKWK